MSKNIESISEFLIHAGTQYLLFDMGRCIRPIDPQSFLAIENGHVRVQNPRQQHFWCGIVYWNKNLSAERYIWFLKLPVDESGCLVDAARQHFLEIIVTALAQASSDENIDLATTEQNSENPYIFEPSQQQLADFNAHTRRLIGISPCKDYQQAVNYLKAPYVQDWRNISLQGLADLVAFASDEEIANILTSLKTLPTTVCQHLLSSMENRTLSQQHAQILCDTIDWCPGIETLLPIYQLRALSQMQDESQRQQLIATALTESKPISKDLLIVIAGRHWAGLNDTNMMQFLEAAAKLDTDTQSFEFFCSLFADIAQLPQTRNIALSALRNPERSTRLSSAIGALFQRKAT